MKRKLRAAAVKEVQALSTDEPLSNFLIRKLRSKLSRSRRLRVSPIRRDLSTNSHDTAVTEEASCVSSLASLRNMNCKSPLDLCNDRYGRVITRLYYRKMLKESINCDDVSRVSENSCVNTCSDKNRAIKFKSTSVNAKEYEKPTKSEVSSTNGGENSTENENSFEIDQCEPVLVIAGGGSNIHREETEKSEAQKGNSLDDGSVSLYSSESTLINTTVPENVSIPKLITADLDLVCSEKLSTGGIANYNEVEEEPNSSSSNLFQFYSDSEFDGSEYTPSFWSYTSGSQFSEKSIVDESPSPTYELFMQFKQEFIRSAFAYKACDEWNTANIKLMFERDLLIKELGLEYEEHEESYRQMRKRERKEQYVHDYVEEYCSTTPHGDLVIQQRLHMVHWIIEQTTIQDIQKETMFLGVNLLDRFLSKGYFNNMRNLQIAGIACLTLAIRIEENQPYNCISKKAFHVRGSMYARCEVVAMEWLVLEVLHFRCYLPTLYNFMWFFLKAASADEEVEKTAKYLAVITLMGHQHLCYWPSTVAAGLVILASIAKNKDASCNRLTAIHANERDKDLPKCIKSMEWLVNYL